jgi:hypothetical protein
VINTSDRPIVLRSGRELHDAILAALLKALDQLKPQLESLTRPQKINNHPFSIVFGVINHQPNVLLDANFIAAAFEISQDISQNSNSKAARGSLNKYLRAHEVPADSLPEIKRGLKLVLVDLWRQRALLLPTIFSTAANFPIQSIDHPLLKWLRSLTPVAPKPTDKGNTEERRLYFYGPRLLWATDWVTPSDISLTDIAALQRAAVMYENQMSPIVIGSARQLPFTALASRALAAFGDQVAFSAEDLKTYSGWVLGRHALTQSLEEFKSSPRTTTQPASGPGAPSSRSTQSANTLPDPANAPNDHEALKKRFCAIRQSSRGDADWTKRDVPSYPGREHVDLSSIAPAWVTAMRAFLHHRAHVKELRSQAEATSALNMLADYIFFYLPWWKELATAPRSSLPASPRAFTRFLFVTRHTSESPDELPAPLLDVIGWRRTSKETIAAAVHQLALFFSFIETHFADDEEIAGKNFRSPIKPEFDAPRINTKHKTNKEVIPKHLYGYLLFYAYALEEIGMKLEQQALDGTLQGNAAFRARDRWLRLADFGISACVKHRMASHVLSEVPNIYSWVPRNLVGPDQVTREVAYVPHCTTLRLLITAVETGLRCQSVQWLDRRTWKSRGDGSWGDSYTFPLFVNTDKVRTEPWVTPVVYRVRDMLKRQEAFQAQFADANAFGPVLYEGNANSPFDRIEPLFRTPTTGNPVSDTAYHATWVHLMIGFEAFYREITGEKHITLYKIRPVRTQDGSVAVRPVDNSSELLWCPLSTVAVHTPHACRATFATNRKGVLELSDTARLLGHATEVVTAHYDKPSIEDLQDRLRASDEAMCKDFLQFEAESEVHVRADKPESALVKSFSRDRSATVKTFGFIPSVTLWATSDTLNDDGLQLLKEGPMSRIRFRETHICPVGEECPLDVVELIGAPKRCGCCPLAMRCIEHITAIGAKGNQLLERIRYLHARIEGLQQRGEPVAVLDELWDELELDVNEFLGWQLSEKMLDSVRQDEGSREHPKFLVEQPEVVKRHLQRISRSGSVAEFVLQRIADSNAYPSMTSPQVQAAAARVKRSLLARKGIDHLTWEDDSSDSIRDAAALLTVAMKSSGLSREQVALALAAPTPDLAPMRLAGESNGS